MALSELAASNEPDAAHEYWCPNGHSLTAVQVRGRWYRRRKQCDNCSARLSKGVSRCSCKACKHHLCRSCFEKQSEECRKAFRTHEEENDHHNKHLDRLREELREANEDQHRLESEQKVFADMLPDLEQQALDAKERYEDAQREIELNAEDRTKRVEEEIDRLEAEVESLAEEEHRFLLHQESFAANGDPAERMMPAVVLARECSKLRDEQTSLEDEAAEFRSEAEALQVVHPELHSELVEARGKNTQSELEISRLEAELLRLREAEDGDLLFRPSTMRTPRGKTRQSPWTSPQKQHGGVTVHEVWRIEAEATASKLRIEELSRELEGALRQSRERQQKHAVDVEFRARRQLARNNLSADLVAELGRDVKPSAETTALAVGIRAHQVIDPHMSARDNSGHSLRRRIEETPRPRPPFQNSSSLLHTPCSSTFGVDSPEVQASNLVTDNAKLRAEVQALHVSLFINGSEQNEAEELELGFKSPLLADPQLETTLSHSRTRLRTMLREQLEDSRKLMASLRDDIAAAEQSLQRERKSRDELAQRLQHSETGTEEAHEVAVTPSKFRAAAASSPEPLPPNLSMRSPEGSEIGKLDETEEVALLGNMSNADHSSLQSAATDSPLSYGGGWAL